MLNAAVDYIRKQTSIQPRVGIVLGSGLGGFADTLADCVLMRYPEIPGFPTSTATGHAGLLCFGSVAGVPVVVMSGRAHLYEGYTPQQSTYGVRLMKLLGIRSLILTNAAGAINTAYVRPSLVLISDHINLMGANPLTGPNDDTLGPRFPDMSEAYSIEYRETAKHVAREQGFRLQEGVYAALSGPSYETPAEIRYLRTIGADLVGMSTVPEVIVANHMGLKVCAISCVTNMAAGIMPVKLNHAEVMEAGEMIREQFMRFLTALVPRLEP